MQSELAGYSDHELHAFCAASRNKRLQDLVLPAEKVRLLWCHQTGRMGQLILYVHPLQRLII